MTRVGNWSRVSVWSHMLGVLWLNVHIATPGSTCHVLKYANPTYQTLMCATCVKKNNSSHANLTGCGSKTRGLQFSSSESVFFGRHFVLLLSHWTLFHICSFFFIILGLCTKIHKCHDFSCNCCFHFSKQTGYCHLPQSELVAAKLTAVRKLTGVGQLCYM